MFEQSLVNGHVRSARKWSIPLSVGLELTLVAGAVAAPLVFFETLPRLQLRLRVDPPTAVRIVRTEIVRQSRPARVAPRIPLPFVAPARIPQAIATIIEEPEPLAGAGPGAESGPYIPGAIPSDAAAQPAWITRAIPKPPPVAAQQTAPPPKPPAQQITRIRIGGVVHPPRLIHEVRPSYPPLARQARISGTVKLEAVLSRDGTIQSLRAVSGHPLLIHAALDAVRQWRYQPTLLNGVPVEVITQITVNFRLTE